MAGPLASRLDAARTAGFGEIMLWASDLVGELPYAEAVRTVRESGLRVTGLQLLRDADGLGVGPQRSHKLGHAETLFKMCVDVGAPMLLVCSNVSPDSSRDRSTIVADLRALTQAAERHGVRLAYEALSWGHAVSDVVAAWEVVQQVDMAGFGLAVDSLHLLAAQSSPEALARMDIDKVFLLQLSDCLTRNLAGTAERLHVARHARVFPGEGLHGDEVVAYADVLWKAGYAGPLSFEVFHDDFGLSPASVVAERACNSAAWLRSRLPRVV